jgi:ankyrin repeat protein
MNDRIARMVQPEPLKSEEYQPWSRGRGVDVWATICAAITGDLSAMRELVARDRRLATCEFEYFQPVRFAVRENHRGIVDFLLEHGANPGYESGDSLLKIARDRGHIELAASLESILRERFQIVPEGPAVAQAIRDRDRTRVRSMLETQPDLVHAADERGNQPIHWAVLTRQVDLIDDLLTRGADINAMRPDGARPLDLTRGDYHYRSWYRDLPWNAIRKHEVLVGYLLARGAYYDISVAAKVGDAERVGALLDQDPGLVNRVPAYCSYYSGLPLRCAAANGHLEVVKLLLERGANPNEPEFDIAPFGGALHAAIGNKHHEIVTLLLEHGANPNGEVESSGNCLLIAKFARAPRKTRDLLLSYGAKPLPGYTDKDVKLLARELDADPSKRIDGPTLDSLIHGGHRKCLELILQHQPDVLAQTPDSTPWWSLGMPKSTKLARWLMERGLDPNRRNWLGITLLHRCAAKGDVNMAQVCLDFGAGIDAVETEWSCTPLGVAARSGKKDMVEWLLAKGANRHAPEDEPWAQPSAWARRQGHQDIADLFSRA